MLRLKELRTLSGLLQSEIADALSISRQSYLFYETGKRSPDVATLLKIAKFYNVSTDYLLGMSDEEIVTEIDIQDLLNQLSIKKLLFNGKELSQSDTNYILKSISLIAHQMIVTSKEKTATEE